LYSSSRLAWPKCLYSAVFLASAWCIEAVHAKEIYIQPSINIETKYDDNIRLMTDRFDGFDTSAYGVITRAKAKVGVRSHRYDIALDNQVVINRYSR
jgi:peroxiredoxin